MDCKLKTINIGLKALLILTTSFLGGASSLAGTKIEFKRDKTILKEILIKGDLRLRHEYFDNPPGTPDRQRQRLRLRLGADFKLPHHLKVKTRFVTDEGNGGEGNQVSTNQTLTNNASKKAIWVDLAFLQWTPIDSLMFNAGKMELPFWRPWSAVTMWDRDYTPEGLAEAFNGVLGPVGFFAELGQFVIQERQSTTQDSYLFSEQGGVELKLPLNARFKTSIAHHEFTNIELGGVGGTESLSSNTPGARFSIVQVNGLFRLWLGSIPLEAQGTWQQNNAAPKSNPNNALLTPREFDGAVQAGLILGQAKKRNNFELAYFYIEVDRDGAVDGIMDSDFGDTNRKGHIAWVGWALTDYMRVVAKHLNTQDLVVADGTDENAIQLTQFDLEIKW